MSLRNPVLHALSYRENALSLVTLNSSTDLGFFLSEKNYLW